MKSCIAAVSLIVVVGTSWTAGARAQQATAPAGPEGQVAAPPAGTEGAAPMTFEDALHALYAPRMEDRVAAIRRLSELGDRAAIPSLREVARQDPDAEVRRNAVIALANLGGTSVLDTLGQAAAEDPSPDVRSTAAEAVRRLGGTPPPAAGTQPPAPPPPTAPAPPPAPPMPIAPDGSSPGPTWLQQQQANAAVGPALGSAAVGPATTLTFEGEDGEQVLIERVIARHSVWVQGAQGGATVEGVSTEPICTTPCTATVPNGGHTFVVEGYEFDVAARGGAETWRVSGNSTAGLWIGQILVYGGGAFALCGAVLLGIMGTGEDSMLTMNASFLGAGLGMLAIGIPVWVLSYGDAERVEGAPGYADAGGGTIAPGILAARTPSGDSVWGLSLSLTL